MVHFSSWAASIVGAPLTLVALMACVTPAGAGIGLNGIGLNGIAVNGVTLNGALANVRIITSSALGYLNGVAVEAVIIPEAAIR